jgi:NitT/TauT family transport system ATP-binding protein
MGGDSMHDIIVDNVHFAYDKDIILENINMEICSGDFVCLLGQSGCGKSTFLRLMAGLAEPASGAIYLDGQKLCGTSLDRGVVFQDYSLFPWFNTGKNITLALKQKYKDKSNKELKQIALDHLEEVGLDASVFDKLPNELSGGMKQRCAISRSFALDPPILLMDEPFGALDAVTRAKLQDMVLTLWKKDTTKRKTIIFVTHDVDEALLLATKIFVFGTKPSQIIYQHSFADTEKPTRDSLFDRKDILDLRNQLIQILHKDIKSKINN